MQCAMPYRSVRRLRTASAGLLELGEGRLWLTRKGDQADYLLVAGESAVLPAGRWLVQALADSAFEWTDRVSALRLSSPCRLDGNLRRAPPRLAVAEGALP
jgi:hypothetical protein